MTKALNCTMRLLIRREHGVHELAAFAELQKRQRFLFVPWVSH